MTGRLAAALAAVTMLLAGCGGGDDETRTETGGASDATVSVGEAATIGAILVDSSGRALYTAEQEADGTIVCEASCLDIWLPLTVSKGETPTAAEGVDGEIATIERDDGTTQVTLEGVPLYTFGLDRSAGDVTGDVTDDFDGVTFTWHVATPSGEAARPNDPGTGGYGY